MEKLYTSKIFSKMAGGRMHTPHPTPLATSYKNHQESGISQSLVTINFVLFHQNAESKGGEGGHGTIPTLPPKHALDSTPSIS